MCVWFIYVEFHLLVHLVENLGRFESLNFTDAAPFENFNVLIKQSYRMTSRRRSTKMKKTVESMSNALMKIKKSKRE